MLSYILPTGYECGVLNVEVDPGGSVTFVGAVPIVLATLLTAQFYAPARIIMIELDDNRLAVARRFASTHPFNSPREDVVRLVRQPEDSKGVDAAIQAVGVPVSSGLWEEPDAPGGAAHPTDTLRVGITGASQFH